MRRALVDMRPDRFEDIIALVALYRPGPMANIPTYCARKLGQRAARIPPSRSSSRSCERDLRHHHLPGTGDADRPGSRRLFARRSRPAAPRHGQEDQARDGRAARALRLAARSSAGSTRRRRRRSSTPARKFADYGFNKIHAAPYALRHLPDRLSEGELPGRVPRRLDDARHAATPTSSPNSAPRRCGSASRSSRRRSTARGVDFEVDGRRASSMRWRRSRASARRRSSRSSRRAASRPFRDLADFAGRINPRAVNKRVLESLAAAGAFDELEPRPRPRPCRPSTRCWRIAQRAHEATHDRAERPVRRRRRARAAAAAGGRAVAAGRAAADANTTRSASSSPAIRSTTTRRVLKKHAGADLGRVRRAGEGGRDRRPARRHRHLAAGAAHQDRQQDGHRRACPTRPASTRRCCSRKGCSSIATCWSPARRCCCSSSAEAQGDDVRARIQTVEPLEKAAEKMQKGLRVFLRSTSAPIESVARRLEARGEGEVSMVLLLARRREVEVKLPGPLQGLAADRRRDQGGAGRGAGRGAVAAPGEGAACVCGQRGRARFSRWPAAVDRSTCRRRT